MEQILARAREQEREYDWMGAVESYRKALALVTENDVERGEVFERLGYGHYRAALQSESSNGFREKMNRAVEEFETSRKLYSKLSGPRAAARSLRCQAMISYLGFWLASEAAEKKRQVDESWRLTKEAMKSFQEPDEPLEFSRTYNQLVTSAFFGFFLDPNFESAKTTVAEAVEQGERAISSLSTHGDTHELAITYVKTGVQLRIFARLHPDSDDKERLELKAQNYWQKANENSEEEALLAFLGPDGASLGESWSQDEQLAILNKALAYCGKTKDRLDAGSTLDWLAYVTMWESIGTEDPDEKLELAKRALQYDEDAQRQYSIISFTSPRGGVIWTGAPDTDYYWTLASWETDPSRRRELLDRAHKAAPELLKRAEHSGYPFVISIAHHYVSKTLESLAKTEKNPEEKRILLEKALAHRNEQSRLLSPIERFHYWNQGVEQNHLAEIKSELSNLAKDPQTREILLQEAIVAKESGVRLCVKEIQSWEKTTLDPGTRSRLGGYQHEWGNLLSRLYALTNDRDHLRKSAEAFENAAESFQKANLASRIAECYWRSALAHDGLDEHLRAAEKFRAASDNYTKAAEKIPQLKDFYQDYASYMDAWSEIEKAKHHHSRQEYGLGKECYEKAAGLHKATKEWSYLAANYSAWAKVENAEDLSRKEQSQEAIEAFEKAVHLFQEGKKSLQAELDKVENADEKNMVTKLVQAADLRRQYCQARVVLEQARLFAKKGDHYSSSENYGKASQSLESIAQALESENTRRELMLIATLSKAWQMMTRAEDEASPGLYLEAAKLFEEAKELSPNEKARSLALGHSRFCRALEAGTRFTDTGDSPVHALAVQHLESASKYYLKADFQSASEYARATELLFDAYAHTDKAKREEDPDKKTKLYVMSEKVLQAAAEAYLKAEQPAKRQQVLKLLEKVKEERELAVTLTEVLHATPIVSTTTTFTAPTPTREAPVGLDRFEHADIQASLIARQRDLRVGEDLSLEIELVNAGRGPAQLVKLEEVVPQGFELTGKPEPYRVEDSYLNMKGKRLDPLKTEEVKLVLRPKIQGQFTLKPRILYLDESGRYKSHEPESIEVTVKELGISGWLKGR